MTSEELRQLANASDEDSVEPFEPSDEEEYVPNPADLGLEASDVEMDLAVEEESDNNESDIDELTQPTDVPVKCKDGSEWNDTPQRTSKTLRRNIVRSRFGAPTFTSSLTAKQLFKLFITDEICSIILRESNRKGRQVVEDYNKKVLKTAPQGNEPPPKVFHPFTEDELDAFFGILIAAGVHRSNKEHVSEMWKLESLPLIRAAMSRDRFKLMLRLIRFDNQNTRAERAKTDKAAPIRDIWQMLNNNLQKNYQPHECITVDEQLFPYRGHTKFTQYIPSKPAKYGIKVFWACDSKTAYPLQGQLYTGKPPERERQTNVGERTVLDLVAKYKGSGRNVTTDNFFTTLQLAKTLASWNLTLVGTVRKNKAFLPAKMQASKERPINSTNFVYSKDATLCSYVPKKNKAVILLSSMHITGEVENTETAKPEIIKYYNHTKGGVDTMDKMLSEYTVKRRTNRWSLAFFYNMIDISGLSSYVIYIENNPGVKSTDKRRLFLKDLASDLCMSAVHTRCRLPRVIANHFTKSSIEMVLGRQMIEEPEALSENLQRDTSGRRIVVGSCYFCRQSSKRRRKTRKSCNQCSKPVCNEHSVDKVLCGNCNRKAE